MNKSNINELSAETKADSNSTAQNQHVSQPNANTNVVGSLVTQREIKFRAWDGEKLIYPVNGWYEKVSLPNHLSYQALQLGQVIRLLTVTQYTGLNNIYEGDILKPPYGDDLYVVFYDEERASFLMKIIGNSYKEYYQLLKWQVIGNVFENPELLQTLR